MLNPNLSRKSLSRSGRRIRNAMKQVQENRVDEYQQDTEGIESTVSELYTFAQRFLKMTLDRRSKRNEVMVYPIPGSEYTIKFWCNPEAKGYTGTQNCVMTVDPEPNRQEKFIESWSLHTDTRMLKKKIKAFYDALIDYVDGMVESVDEISANEVNLRDQIREGVIEINSKIRRYRCQKQERF